MVILGIDPGLATLGWGVIQSDGSKHKLLQYGTLGTKAGNPLPLRLRSLFSGMQQLIQTFSPDEIAVEELFFSKNVTTGMAVSAARGVILVAAAQYTENLYEYTPMQIKQAVAGYGKADKQQVQAMVRMLLSLQEIPKPDDAADGLAVAITHAHSWMGRQMFKIK